MDRDAIFTWFIHFAVALYFGCWYNSLIPILLTSQAIDYNFVGICGALSWIIGAFYFYYDLKVNKYLLALSVVLSAVLYIIAIVNLLFWLIVVISILQGILIGFILSYSQKTNQIKKALPLWSLGLLFSMLTYFFSSKLTYSVQKKAFSYVLNADLNLLIFYLIVLLFLLSAVLMMKTSKESQFSSPTKVDKLSPISVIGYLITGGLILTEVSFVYWSLILKDESQGWTFQLILPLVLFFLFLFRQFLTEIFSKHNNIGWLFVSVLFISLSLGLFYTFGFTPIFIIFFSLFMAFAIGASSHIFKQNWDIKSTSILLLFIATSMIIGGLYIQNHIEFVLSINMPKEVLNLSAKQAWMKELASLAGIITIVTGYIFLRRRSMLHF